MSRSGNCKYCGKLFSAEKSHQVYCSDKCRTDFWGHTQYQKNKTKIAEKNDTDKYRARQRELTKQPHRKESRNTYLKEKRKTDIEYKLKTSIIDRLRHEFSEFRVSELETYLGYSINQLAEHLFTIDEQKTLYLSGKLETDHIIPYCWYIVLTLGDIEFRKCWSMSNLRLLDKTENRQRLRKIDWQLVKQLNIQHLLPRGADVIYLEF
jgi:hypothetical protein